MKIITYNVNGLRAAVGKGLPEWLAQEQPDVLCLQETKLQPEQYPAEAFEALGYKAWLFSAQKKGYSGVAILSRREPDHVEYGMGIEKYDNEGRFIRADFGDLSVISVYHPSGTTAMSVRHSRWNGWKIPELCSGTTKIASETDLMRGLQYLPRTD